MQQNQNNASNRTITVDFGRSNFLAKVIVILLSGTLIGSYVSADATREISKANEISLSACAEEPCLEEVAKYKRLLNEDQSYTDPVYSISGMLFALVVLLGFYELFSFLLGLIIRKII